MPSLLDDLIARVTGLSPEEYDKTNELVASALNGQVWLPQVGPQTDAYFSKADELFYGGQAGGGKTDLLVGLSLTAHTDSLIMLRINKDVRDIMDRVEGVLGNTEGRNLSLWEWKRGEGYTLELTHDRKSEVSAVLSGRGFFKLARFVPFDDPAVREGRLVEIGCEAWRTILPVITP